MWYENILETIGNTPLVKINRIGEGLPCTVLAKLEYFNPGASVKDRIGVAMVEDAERRGLLRPGGTIIEGTSGNTGAGLALAAIAKGYKCIFTTTDKQSPEKVNVLRALGAEVRVCPTNVAPEDPRSYYSVARRLATEIPNSFYINQYDNPSNAEAHYATTGPELWEQTEHRITHYIAGAGTGGTISGTAKYLKEQNPDIQVVGVDPFGSVYYKYFYTREFDHAEIYPYLIEGVGEDILAKNMDFDLVDHYERVTDRDAMIMTRRLALDEGFFVGQSCGMVMAGALQWLWTHRSTLRPEDVVVIIMPDSGFRYLGKTYNDTWMRDHGFLEREDDLSVEQVLSNRRQEKSLIGVHPDDSLGKAIQRMSENNISQLPVMEGETMVGSLSESGILNLLIQSPDAREKSVREVMDGPFPLVSSRTTLAQVSGLLEKNVGAVLVELGKGKGYQILTRSDLIGAIAATGRTGRNTP